MLEEQKQRPTHAVENDLGASKLRWAVGILTCNLPLALATKSPFCPEYRKTILGDFIRPPPSPSKFVILCVSRRFFISQGELNCPFCPLVRGEGTIEGTMELGQNDSPLPLGEG